MEEVSKKNAPYYIGLVCGFLAIAMCIVTLGLSVVNNKIGIYTLSSAVFFLALNRVGLHLSNFKKNMFENIVLTIFLFVLPILIALTKYNIYFLITSMFTYSLTVIIYCLIKMNQERTTQSYVFHSLAIVFSFLYSFVFFFPGIYAQHATTVSNSNFIVFLFSILIIVSTSKNIIFPYHKTLKINVVSKIIKKSMLFEIIMVLLIIVILCSVYFTLVEVNITSYVDALWYSFAVITTIGFGDVSVTTTFGRMLSVILGVSGIVVVALFTSFIVNFYNEMNRKRDDKKLEEYIDEEVKKVENENSEKEPK